MIRQISFSRLTTWKLILPKNHAHIDGPDRRAFRAFVDDGIADIILGAFVLNFALVLGTDLDQLTAGLVVLTVPIWRKLRSRFVEPRSGFVRLKEERLGTLRRNKATVGVALLFCLVTLVFLVAGPDRVQGWTADNRALLPGIVLSVPLATGGLVLQIGRLYGYAFLLVTMSVTSHALHAQPAMTLVVTGAAIVATGLTLLTKFVRRYPIDEYSHRGMNDV